MKNKKAGCPRTLPQSRLLKRKAFTKILTEDLVLTKLNAQHINSDYLKWFSEKSNIKYLEVRFHPPKSLNDLRKYVFSISSDPQNLFLGIFKKNNLKHIGNIKLGPIDKNHKVANLGFWIGQRKEQGKGYATQAVIAVCRFAFKHLGLKKICAGCYEENLASQKTLLKAGFTLEGVQKSHWLQGGKRQNGKIFGLLNSNRSSF